MAFTSDWVTSTGPSTTTVGTSFILSAGLSANRSMCRVSGVATQVDSYTVNLYRNDVLINTFTNNTNTTISACPSVISTSRSFGTQTFSGGDVIIVEWIDTTTA